MIPAFIVLIASIPGHAKRSKALEIPEIPERFRDAPALVLYDGTSTHLRPHEDMTSHWRKRTILIQTEDGLDAANQSFTYDASSGKLTDFEARIYPPSGGRPKKVSSEFIQKIDAVSVGRRELRGEVKVAFPAVEVGSIIEWEAKWYHEHQIVVRHWALQERYPRLKTTYFLALYGRFMDTVINYSTSSPTRVKEHCKLESVSIERMVQKKRMTCLNVPAWKSEPGAPPRSEARMSAYLSFRPNAAEKFRQWSAEYINSKAGALLETSPAVQGALTNIKANESWSKDKIRAVDDWVRQNLEIEPDRDCRFASGKQGSSAGAGADSYCRNAGEVLEHGAGDAFEIASAEYALMEEAGLRPNLAVSTDRSEGWVDKDVPSLRWRHPILILRASERTWRLFKEDILIDVGCATCLPDETRWEVSGKGAISYLVEPAGGKGFMLPAPRASENALEVRDALRIDNPARPLEGLACWKAQLAIDRRERLHAAETEDDPLEANHGELLSFDDEALEFTELSTNQRGSPFCVEFAGEASGLFQTLGDRALFSAPALLGEWLDFPSSESRRLPVDLGFSRSLSYERTIRLPEGAEVEDLPEPLVQESLYVRFEGAWTVEEPTKIVLNTRFEILRGRVPADAYSRVARAFLELRSWLHARAIVRLP